MVLPWRRGGRVGHRRTPINERPHPHQGGAFRTPKNNPTHHTRTCPVVTPHSECATHGHTDHANVSLWSHRPRERAPDRPRERAPVVTTRPCHDHNNTLTDPSTQLTSFKALWWLERSSESARTVHSSPPRERVLRSRPPAECALRSHPPANEPPRSLEASTVTTRARWCAGVGSPLRC